MSDMNEGYRSIWSQLMLTRLRQDWVDAGGIRTRYVQAGADDRPALIMVHGTASSWESFSANLQAHAAHFTCYALDMLGSGFSDKPDRDYTIPDYVEHLSAFMAALGIERAAFIGVSLGSWIVSRFAHTYPDKTEKLILLAPVGLATNKPPASTTGAIRERRKGAIDSPTWDSIAAIFAGLMRDERNRIPDLIKLRQAIYLQPEMKRAMEHILTITTPEAFERDALGEAEWRAIGAPALIVEATDDQPFYVDTARRLAEIMPRASLLRMSDVGHWAQFEDPARFNAASLDFLMSTPEPGRIE